MAIHTLLQQVALSKLVEQTGDESEGSAELYGKEWGQDVDEEDEDNAIEIPDGSEEVEVTVKKSLKKSTKKVTSAADGQKMKNLKKKVDIQEESEEEVDDGK